MKTKTPLVLLVILIIVVILIATVASSMQKSGVVSAPAATSSSDTVVSSVVTVTQADNGSTVTVKKGGRILLKLGDGQWDVSVGDQSVISRVPNVMVIRGAQGLYNALKVGTTKLSAQGRPACQPGQMCAQYIIDFSTTVKVI